MVVCLFCSNTRCVGAKVMSSFLLLSEIHHNQTRFLYFFLLIYIFFFFFKKVKLESDFKSLEKSTAVIWVLAGILGMHSTVSSPSLSFNYPTLFLDAAHLPSQPTVTVLEMSKGKYFYKVQSKTQLSKGGRVPREGISRHKDAAALLQRSGSAPPSTVRVLTISVLSGWTSSSLLLCLRLSQ